MDIAELINIKTLEDESNVFGQSEKHTRYTTEIKIFSCVQQGDINKLIKELKNINALVVTGKLSNDSVMQYRYLAVSTITLATRYAIQGGLNEKEAYDFSDRVIMLVDSMNSKIKILNLLVKEIINLTNMVNKSKLKPSQSPHVRKCICYINENINEKITVSMLSEICNISSDYLSQIFKDEMGENLSTYITKRKLETAKDMIVQGKSNHEICESLGFSSVSHFITAFKRNYTMTPTEYFNLTK